MKNIFRRSVQIFHKKDKEEGDKSTNSTKKDSLSKATGSESPYGSKKDKKSSKRSSKSLADMQMDSGGGSPNGSIGRSPPSSPPMIGTGIIPIGYTHGHGDGRRVFGVALVEVPCRDGSKVPIIVEKLVDHLERTALSTEGVFRIPGRDVTILECVRLFDSGADVDVSTIEPYTAAGLLKRFFRDLPTFVPPSINKQVAALFVTEDGKKKQIDMEVLEKLRQLVHHLPPHHFEVMESLTGLLGKLLAKSAENKMTVSNIAICLVPTLNCVPAIVTYPIQYHDFFFREPFAEHHHPHMRPMNVNSFLPTVEEKSELASEMQKRYSRPASITISGLLPTNNTTAVSSSPSSGGAITSTTITSPHYNDSTTPITFTVTTTYLDEQQQQQQGSSTPSIQITDHIGTLERNRRAKEDLQYLQFIEEHKLLQNQYNIEQNSINSSSNSTFSNPNSSVSNRSLYRRSMAIPLQQQEINDTQQPSSSPSSSIGFNNNITKANIQQLKEKIDRYSKEKLRELRESQRDVRTTSSSSSSSTVSSNLVDPPLNSSSSLPKDNRMYRYSVDFERFNQNHRNSRDIGREIEREINKRLSPRERISMLLNNNNNDQQQQQQQPIQNNNVNNNNNRNYRYSNQFTYTGNSSNNTTSTSSTSSSSTATANKYVTTRDNNNNRNSNRYSRDITSTIGGGYLPSYNDEGDEIYLNRQRSQSCFEQDPNLINNNINSGNNGSNSFNSSIGGGYGQPSQSLHQSILLEQKLDKLKETINNIKLDRDNRTSRDYTTYIRDIDELTLSLQKESETSEFFAVKSLQLVEKLRHEEEKNQKLMEEINLMESYFHLKEKLKRSKRQSKQLLTRSRSPTLPASMNPLN